MDSSPDLQRRQQELLNIRHAARADFERNQQQTVQNHTLQTVGSDTRSYSPDLSHLIQPTAPPEPKESKEKLLPKQRVKKLNGQAQPDNTAENGVDPRAAYTGQGVIKEEDEDEGRTLNLGGPSVT